MELNKEIEPTITMVNIEVLYVNYKKLLASKIKEVCTKVGFSYKGIEWIIYDNKNSDIGDEENMMKRLLNEKIKEDEEFGFCDLVNKIWISTKTITNNHSIDKIINERDLLADIILQGIAYMSTKRKPGQEIYDTELKRLRNIYDNGMISIRQL